MIKYKDGYRYQLVEDYTIQTPIKPLVTIAKPPYYVLTTDGMLYIRAGFAWDGASGPTFDTKSSMRPSLVHDALCQMMEDRTLDYKAWSPTVHRFFKEMCLEDGMSPWRAWIWHIGVIIGQGGNPDIEDDNPVQTAP